MGFSPSRYADSWNEHRALARAFVIQVLITIDSISFYAERTEFPFAHPSGILRQLVREPDTRNTPFTVSVRPGARGLFAASMARWVPEARGWNICFSFLIRRLIGENSIIFPPRSRTGGVSPNSALRIFNIKKKVERYIAIYIYILVFLLRIYSSRIYSIKNFVVSEEIKIAFHFEAAEAFLFCRGKFSPQYARASER